MYVFLFGKILVNNSLKDLTEFTFNALVIFYILVFIMASHIKDNKCRIVTFVKTTFWTSMHIRAAFIIASEAIYSPSAEYKRVPDKIINKAKQWSEQYPKKIEFQEAYFGLLFSRLKYAQAQDMRNEQRRVYREMKTVAERANYSEYNESNQLMESVDILHRVFGY